MTSFSTFFFLLVSFSYPVNAQSLNVDINTQFQQFDFWIGEWNVYKTGTDTLVGQSSIKSITDGKAISEKYRAEGSNYNGTSLNSYNPQTGKWEQYWSDNTGYSVFIQGNFANGQMVLENTVATSEGQVGNRITWTDNRDNTVRQVWEQKYPGADEWTPVFDGTYKAK